MADIRPAASGLPGPQTAPTRPANEARSAAQRAFFQQALGQSAAPAAVPAAGPAAPIRTETAVTPARVVETPVQGEAPPRYMRPGSLLDIKV